LVNTSLKLGQFSIVLPVSPHDNILDKPMKFL
jgi:hypothetical protein